MNSSEPEDSGSSSRFFSILAYFFLISGIVVMVLLLLVAAMGAVIGGLAADSDGGRWAGSLLCSLGFMGSAGVALVCSGLFFLVQGIGRLYAFIKKQVKQTGEGRIDTLDL